MVRPSQTNSKYAAKRPATEKLTGIAKAARPAPTYVSKPARILEPPHVPIQNRKPEKKTVDQVILSSFDATGTVTALCIPALGSGPYQRLGRQTELDSLYVTGFIEPTGTGTVAILPDVARLMVVYDRSPVGSNPAISDVLQDIDASNTKTTTAFSGLNLDNKKRFVILMDERIYLPGCTGTTTGPPTVGNDTNGYLPIVKRYIKLGGLLQEYKASTPAVADITTGALFLITYSRLTAAGSTTIYKYGGTCRLNYRDA